MNISGKSHQRPSKQQRIPARLAYSDPWCFLGLGFGSGLAPKAPGTLGTLAAIPLYAFLMHAPPEIYLATTILLFIAGIPICSFTEKRIGIQDHSGIVWDEIVGFLLTLTLLPPNMTSLTLGFIFFRLFDILKPWPIRWFDQKVHGGLGIMLDDAIAGLLACATTHAILSIIGS
jgi:phosphatidylglycerophosphatase A